MSDKKKVLTKNGLILYSELFKQNIKKMHDKIEALINTNKDDIIELKEKVSINQTNISNNTTNINNKITAIQNQVNTNIQNISNNNININNKITDIQNSVNTNTQYISDLQKQIDNIEIANNQDTIETLVSDNIVHNNHISDTSIHFTKDDILKDVNSNIVTTGYNGQILSIKDNKVIPKNVITLASLKINDNEIQASLNQKPLTLEDVFKSWTKFAHYTNYKQGIRSSSAVIADVAAWSYNSSLNAIQNTRNTESYVGFIQPEKKQNWRVKIMGKGTDSDNDYFAIVIGFISASESSDGKEHTISLIRASGNKSEHISRLFSLEYDFGNNGWTPILTLKDGTSLVTDNDYTWQKTAYIQVQRKQNYIKCETSQMGMSDLTASFEFTMPETKPSNWTQAQFDNISKMLNEPSQMGFAMMSQPGYFQLIETDNVFDSSDIYDTKNNIIYKYNNSSKEWKNSGKITDEIENYTILYSKDNDTLAYVADNNLYVLNNTIKDYTDDITKQSGLSWNNTCVEKYGHNVNCYFDISWTLEQSKTNLVLGTLPAAVRPRKNISVNAVTNLGTCNLYINTSGEFGITSLNQSSLNLSDGIKTSISYFVN